MEETIGIEMHIVMDSIGFTAFAFSAVWSYLFDLVSLVVVVQNQSDKTQKIRPTDRDRVSHRPIQWPQMQS